MSLPDLDPKKTVSGIAVDPRTLERVIPESQRPDGSVRKQIKIRPGYTPQEDVSRFRSARQQQVDRNALPKGHILGWVAPSSGSKPKTGGSSGGSDGDKPLSKSAAKNAKRKAKKQADKDKIILANWEDDDDVDIPKPPGKKGAEKDSTEGGDADESKGKTDEEEVRQEESAMVEQEETPGSQLADELEKLEVK